MTPEDDDPVEKDRQEHERKWRSIEYIRQRASIDPKVRKLESFGH